MTIHRAIRSNASGVPETVFDSTANADKVLIVDASGTVINAVTGDVIAFDNADVDHSANSLQLVASYPHIHYSAVTKMKVWGENIEAVDNTIRQGAHNSGLRKLNGAKGLAIAINLMTVPSSGNITFVTEGQILNSGFLKTFINLTIPAAIGTRLDLIYPGLGALPTSANSYLDAVVYETMRTLITPTVTDEDWKITIHYLTLPA